MKHLIGRLSSGIYLIFSFLLVCSFFFFSPLMPRDKAFASGSTLTVNANQVLRPVTHVAAGGLYGLANDTTPDDSMVTPLHPREFVQMAPNGQQLPNGETTPGGDALVVAP